MPDYRIKTTTSALALALMAPAALAQDGTISIYTYQTGVDLGSAGVSVDVMDETALEENPEGSVSAKLDSLPGVSITPAGPLGGTVNLRLRGLSGAYAPVYVNGIDVSDPSAPKTEFYWENILPGSITRAEVIRGSQSARFGSNAIAGAVAMQEVRAPQIQGKEASIHLETGSYGTTTLTVGAGVATQRAGIAFQVGSVESKGYSSLEDVANMGDTDGFAGQRLSFDAYVDATDDIRLGLTGFRQRHKAEYDNCKDSSWVSSEDCYNNNISTGLRAYAEISYGAVSHEIDLTRFEISRDDYQDGKLNNASDGKRRSWSYRGSWDTTQDLTLSTGVDGKTESRLPADDEASLNGVFTEALWTPTPGLDLAMSLRRDKHSLFGIFDSSRASVSYQIDGTTVHIMAAKGFRAPSLDELFDTTYGNTNLQPETSKSYELGISQEFTGGARVSATLFRTEITDLIAYFDPDGSAGPIPGKYDQVQGTSRTEGFELTGYFPLGEMAQFEGNYTNTKSSDQKGIQQQRVPQHDLSLSLSGNITQDLSAGLSLQRKMDWAPTYGAGFSKENVDDFTTVSARIAYDFTPGLTGYMRVENLTNTQYQVIPDYQTADRSVYFGINADF